jgi:hypothetical protein
MSLQNYRQPWTRTVFTSVQTKLVKMDMGGFCWTLVVSTSCCITLD